ncbi:uncharacterized protein At3g49140-like isoform X2 [Nicotiana tomentosiformis]|uniref:Uncharacterized protein At3g49140 isoform X2 n=1 Tax=Nicotiana tabacum TaxID=4097 RepID=A0A1S3YCR2_TOBAC|nr:uncharacterized protein At3g49140-like isoform X2 [Nicotiana tomentosiformis]XP_016449792.1 PREDICTED: uncharacterized protein At3g49140-like isoform X2 [Nicotiana tabacum]
MLTVEHAAATIRFSAVNFDATSRRLSHSVSFFIPRDKFGRLADNYAGGGRRACKDKNGGIKATAKDHFSSGSEPVKQSRSYHPSEDIGELELMENEDARLKPAECSRTIIEGNSEATLMFSSAVSDVMHANIFWPDLPYTTDELGNVYFQVKNDEDVLKNPTEEESVVDWVSILDDEEDHNGDPDLGYWATLETMRSSHPIDFAKAITEVVTDDPIDFMDQPPAGLVIQGLLRTAFLEEHAAIPKQISEHKSNDAGIDQIEKVAEYKQNCSVQVNGHKHESGSSQDGPSCPEELEKDETLGNGTSFYKLEMIKIQLISSHGHQILVELDDFSQAKPDAIAHSAANIISRLKAVGENTTQALRSLCWRCKGIQVEEVALIGVDSLGFDLRVCSGAQVQTLRFSFKKQASSEYSAERQLNDLLYPRFHPKLKKKETHQAES